MKITKREKVLLIILFIIAIFAGYYNFIFIPQREKIKKLEATKESYEMKKRKIDNMDKIINKKETNVKILNYKIQDKTIKLFPNIQQEKLILQLDDLLKKSDLNGFSITFSDKELSPVEGMSKEQNKDKKNLLKDLVDEYNGNKKDIKNKIEQNSNEKAKNNQDSNKKDEKKDKTRNPVEAIKATVNFKGNYLNVIEFIKRLEKFEKTIVVSDIKISKDTDTDVTGTATLEFYAVPKIGDEDKDFLKWDIKNKYGKQNPFDGIIGISNGSNSTIEDIQKLNKEDHYDFVMAVRCQSSDLPTIMLGKAQDKSKSTYVYADNPVTENVEIHLIKDKGKYYFKYKTERDSYPTNFNGKGLEFNPNKSTINLKIYSNKRVDAKDLSSANIKIYNKTDKEVNVNIEDDDITKPRINITSEGANVNVKRN